MVALGYCFACFLGVQVATKVTDDGKLLLVAGVFGLVVWLVMILGGRWGKASQRPPVLLYKGPSTNIVRTLGFYIGSYKYGLGEVLCI